LWLSGWPFELTFLCSGLVALAFALIVGVPTFRLRGTYFGIGTLWGPVAGAALYILVREELALSLVQVHQIIFGALFILVVLAFPGGLVDAAARLTKRSRST
jgi:ABC-type branched-subunit amino acid transport system permease subunit